MCTINNSNGSLEAYFADSRELGQYYKMNTGTSDNGLGIFFEVVSRGYHHDQPLVDKLFRDIEILGKAASKLYSLQVCYRLDYSPRDEACLSCVLPVDGGLWEPTAPEVFTWAYSDNSLNGGTTLSWAGEQTTIETWHAHRKAQHLQVVFRQTDVDAPITLIGWGSVASLFGRK